MAGIDATPYGKLDLLDVMGKQTVSALYCAAMVDILAEFGMERTIARDCLGMTEAELQDPRKRIGLKTLRTLFAEAADTLNRPTVGLDIGFAFRVSTFAETGSVLALCRDLREAAEMNSRYQPLVETVGVSSLWEEGGAAGLMWTPSFADDEAYRHVTELIVGGYAATVRWLTWSFGTQLGACRFRHVDPGADAHRFYVEVLGAVPTFGASANVLEFAEGTVDRPLPTHAPDTLVAVRKKLDGVLFGSDVDPALMDALKAGLPAGFVTRDAFAASQGMTGYALDRVLAEAGTTFRDVLELARKARFRELSESGMPLSDIALELGYAEQASLTRAFRRWYGVSPSKYPL